MSLKRHLTLSALTLLFLAEVRSQDVKKTTELTVCQVRIAADAMIRSCWLPEPQRQAILQHASNKIRYYQTRNACSRRSHRKETIRALHRCGLTLRSLRRCESG